MKLPRILFGALAAVLASTMPASASRPAASHHAKVVTVGEDVISDDEYAAAMSSHKRAEDFIKQKQQEIIADAMLAYAKTQIGKPYRSGSAGPKSFDCSGFTSYVFHQFGYDLNRDSRSQYRQGEAVSRDDVQPGDLIFFSGRKVSKNVGHVGIVTEVNPITGAIKFIHASISRGVRIDSLNDAYYSRRFIGIKRVLTPEDLGLL